MNKENLKTGNKIQSNLREIKERIERLTGGMNSDKPLTFKEKVIPLQIDILMNGNRHAVRVWSEASDSSDISKEITEEIGIANQSYRDKIQYILNKQVRIWEEEFKNL